MKLVVTQKIMPPWYALFSKYGHFSNERSLSAARNSHPGQWGEFRRAEGRHERYASAAADFRSGLGIPTPMLFFSLPPFRVASAVMDYQYVIIPTDFYKYTGGRCWKFGPPTAPWFITSSRTCAEPGSNYFKDQKTGVFFVVLPPKVDEKTRNPAQRFSRRFTWASASRQKFFIMAKAN